MEYGGILSINWYSHRIMVVLLVTTVRSRTAVNYTDYHSAKDIDPTVILKLTRLGHLAPTSANDIGSALRDMDHLRAAVKQFQKFAALPQTGIVDEETKRQFSKPRCGRPDVESAGQRHRRYLTVSSGWQNREITWSLDRMTHHVPKEKIQQAMKDAFQVWETSGMLRFRYEKEGKGDIQVGFHKHNHNDGYPFDGAGGVLAHAFYPGSGIGGDVHFDDSESWNAAYDYNSPDLYSAGIHELGHSLGLAHSSRQDAIMFPYYQTIERGIRLPLDDMLGVRKIYSETGYNSRTTKRPRVYPRPTSAPSPDQCRAKIDAVSVINGDTFLFSGRFYWRISRYYNTKRPIVAEPISRFWYGLPAGVDRIDAIYSRPHDGKVIIFIGRRYWMFINNEAEPGYPQPLTRLGIGSDVSHIDAAFVWSHNQQTYFFSGSKYWRFDESRARVMQDYPRNIKIWAGVPANVGAVFQQKGTTYFLRGNKFWQFDDRRMRVVNTRPSHVGSKWLGCFRHYSILENLQQPPSNRSTTASSAKPVVTIGCHSVISLIIACLVKALIS